MSADFCITDDFQLHLFILLTLEAVVKVKDKSCFPRLWNVSRTESQIKENMITVDPKSEGLAAYYKLNGTDQFQDGETWKVKDASGHGMDGLVNGGDKALGIVELDEPITIK